MSSLSTIKIRRDARQKLVKIQGMLRTKGIDAEQKEALRQQAVACRQIINNTVVEIDKEEVQKRRMFLAANPGLQDIFNALWMIFLPHTENGILTKDGYGKFYQSICVALVGKHSFEDLLANVDQDWVTDTNLFGQLSKDNFFDFLFETIEVYSDIVNPSFYAAFSWALLDSIADTALQPPRLRPLREIECITELDSEVKVVQNFLRDKKIRSRMAITNQFLSRIPEVQLRLQGRRRGRTMDVSQQEMVEAITMGMGGAAEDDTNEGFDDEDDDEQGEHVELADSLCRSPKSRRSKGIAMDVDVADAEDADEAEAIEEDEDVREDDEDGSRTGDLPVARSFIGYIEKRKNSVMELNGSLGRDRSSSMLRLSGPSGINRPVIYDPPISIPAAQPREPNAASSSSMSKFAQFMASRGRDHEDSRGAGSRERYDGNRSRSLSPVSGGSSIASATALHPLDNIRPWDHSIHSADSPAPTSSPAIAVRDRPTESHSNGTSKAAAKQSSLADMQLSGKGLSLKITESKKVVRIATATTGNKEPDLVSSFLANQMERERDRDRKPTNRQLDKLEMKQPDAGLQQEVAQPPTENIQQKPQLHTDQTTKRKNPKREESKADKDAKRGAFLTVSNSPKSSSAGGNNTSSAPYFMTNIASSPLAPSDRVTSPKTQSTSEAVSLSLSHVGEMGFSDYRFLLETALANELQRKKLIKSQSMKSIPTAAELVVTDTDDDSSTAPTVTGIATLRDPYFMMNVDKQGFHDPFSIENVLAYKTGLERQLEARRHRKMSRPSNSFPLTQGDDESKDEKGRFSGLLPDHSHGRKLLSPMTPRIGGAGVASKQAHGVRSPAAIKNTNAQYLRKFTDDLSVDSSVSALHIPPIVVASDFSRLSCFGSSLSNPSDLLLESNALAPPSIPGSIPKSTSPVLNKSKQQLKSPGKTNSAAFTTQVEEDLGHFGMPAHLHASASHTAVRKHATGKTLLHPSISPIEHPCHESFLKVSGSLSSAEFRSQQRLAMKGALAGCSTAPWNQKSLIEPYLDGHRDLVAGWKDKVSVIRAAPLYPVNVMIAAAKHQDTVKQSFLTFVKQHKSQQLLQTMQKGEVIVDLEGFQDVQVRTPSLGPVPIDRSVSIDDSV